MFLAGLIAFTAASLAGGLAQDPVLLVAVRAVQGAGAALVAPAALSLVTTGFPGGPKRTKALGRYGATASVGFVAGQVLGGFLVEFTSWRAVFLVNVPVGLAAMLLTPRLLGRGRERRVRRRLDIGGAVLITAAVAAVVFTVYEGGAVGFAVGHVAGVTGDRAAMLAGAVLAGLATLIAPSQGRRGQRRPVR